jgi:hypothetical protein
MVLSFSRWRARNILAGCRSRPTRPLREGAVAQMSTKLIVVQRNRRAAAAATGPEDHAAEDQGSSHRYHERGRRALEKDTSGPTKLSQTTHRSVAHRNAPIWPALDSCVGSTDRTPHDERPHFGYWLATIGALRRGAGHLLGKNHTNLSGGGRRGFVARSLAMRPTV